MYEEIKQYLTIEPKARQRSNKNRAIGNLISKKFGIDIEKSKMADMVGEILSADRAWRLVLEKEPSLRGSDYEEKVELEIKKQHELGYGIRTN